MNLKTYLKNKKNQIEAQDKFRSLCTQCLQPGFSCYCSAVSTFNPMIKVVILIHPIETKRRIATGRMAHLCLENSELIVGQNYSANTRVNEILSDPSTCPLVLYPGKESLNISTVSVIENSFSRHVGFRKDKKLVLFVIDGTWATAKKTMYQSKNLKTLPQICFTPQQVSQFKVRKQPHKLCLSTIEAIHHVLELLGPTIGFNTSQGEHHKLLEVFHQMVSRQLSFISEARKIDSPTHYRKPFFEQDL